MKNDNVPLIEYTSLFNKQRQAVPLEIKEAFLEALRLFLTDPVHPVLRNHLLHGKLTGYRSIDVTEDYRAVFRETLTGRRALIVFHLLGTHKDLY
jgi:mRNA-degrading endonuclease YafQ of YafQ-DinJ toxin-antitoxin module